MTSKLTSKEIRAMSFNTDNAWQDYFKLVQEIAALMAERDERVPAPEAASAAPPSDAVKRALDAFNDAAGSIFATREPMTAALSTFAEALLEESDKTCKVLYSDERSLVNRVLTKAISNLLPEVKP
jgi:RNA-splicing ligase RtcB